MEAFLDTPATRWDRLVAVLQDVEPSLAINALHLIELKKQNKMTDVELFYCFTVCYQDRHSKMLGRVLSLYIFLQSWLDWLQELHKALQAYEQQTGHAFRYAHLVRGSHRSEALERSLRGLCPSLRRPQPPPLLPSGAVLLRPPQSRGAEQPAWSRRSTAAESASTTRRFVSSVPDERHSGTLKGKGEKHEDPEAAEAADGPHTVLHELLHGDGAESIFQLLRDGEFLCQLLVDLIELKEEQAVTPLARRTTSTPDKNTFASPHDAYLQQFPPLVGDTETELGDGSPTFRGGAVRGNRLSSRSGATATAGATAGVQLGAHERADFFLKGLNELCNEYLATGVKADFDQFLDARVFNPVNRAVLLTRHELEGLHRLHWLTVALHRFVQDESIVPRPSPVSRILLGDPSLQCGTHNLEEESEIAFRVATKVSCLPHHINLDVTFHENLLHCRNAKSEAVALTYHCIIMHDEVYAYFREFKVFLPVPVVLKWLLQEWDGIPWLFGTSSSMRKQLEVLELVPPEGSRRKSFEWDSPPSSLNPRALGTDQGSHPPAEADLGWSPPSIISCEGRAFDLTVHPPPASQPWADGRSPAATGISVCSLSRHGASGVQSASRSGEPAPSCVNEGGRVDFSATIVSENDKTGIEMIAHHFRIRGNLIGKGAFGAVFKALDLVSGNFVAVKQSRYTVAGGREQLNWKEFVLWSMLPPHPNVITFHGASVDEVTNQIMLVLEYASGGCIKTLYRDFSPVPDGLFLKHAAGIALGLNHLHDHGVLHGDMKPENVLTRSDGSVAISDFGCSRVQLSTAWTGEASAPSSMALAGTVAYMAPEVTSSSPELASDVWAYACTLIQLWTGESPWARSFPSYNTGEAVALLYYVYATEGAIPYTAEQIGATPKWLQKVASRSLERDPSKRCTMREILSILAEWE